MGAKLDPNQTAAVLSIARSTLARWRVERWGPPYIRLRGAIRYDADDLNEWMRRRTVPAREAEVEPRG